MINLGLRNPIWSGIVALTFILPSRYGVAAVTFKFQGSSDWPSDVCYSDEWTVCGSSIFLGPSFDGNSVAGRLLYPQPVRMKDSQTRKETSFSCSFIFQIFARDGDEARTGSGLTFMMVPDMSTVGAPEGYMGLLSTNISEAAHTFAVELDTYMNPEFDDPNNNHIGIDLASMNSTATFIPQFRLAHNRSNVYHQVWIDYYQTVDIYIAEYGHGKPTKPFSTSVNMSLLNEYMYIGFSAAVEKDVDNRITIFAWSFSTEGPAPFVSIDQDLLPPTRSPPPPPAARGPPVTSLPPPAGAAKTAGFHIVRLVGIILGIIGAICIGMAILCLTKPPLPNADQPLRFYLAHTGADKNFTEQLYEDLQSTWRYRLNRIKVFFDRQSLRRGENLTVNIKRELSRAHVGVVVVSREFFEKLWPMTELVYLMRSMSSNDEVVRILPLFYRLTVDEVRDMVRVGTWDGVWGEMASPRLRHPLDAGECRTAVNILCDQYGVSYDYTERNNDARYRQDVLKVVDEICNEMQEQWSRCNFEE